MYAPATEQFSYPRITLFCFLATNNRVTVWAEMCADGLTPKNSAFTNSQPYRFNIGHVEVVNIVFYSVIVLDVESCC